MAGLALGCHPERHSSPQSSRGKFSHIKSSIDTGVNVNNAIIKPKIRRGFEAYTRFQSARIHNLIRASDVAEESIYCVTNERELEGGPVPSVTVEGDEEEEEHDRDYLLIDIRSEESFEKYHIRTAISFPSIDLRRDKTPPEIYKYKNKTDKYIIVCGNDEKEAMMFTKTLVIKFITDNICLLGTSVRKHLQNYPSDAIGTPPPPEKPSDADLRRQSFTTLRSFHGTPKRDTRHLSAPSVSSFGAPSISSVCTQRSWR
eukprot:155500_1